MQSSHSSQDQLMSSNFRHWVTKRESICPRMCRNVVSVCWLFTYIKAVEPVLLIHYGQIYIYIYIYIYNINVFGQYICKSNHLLHMMCVYLMKWLHIYGYVCPYTFDNMIYSIMQHKKTSHTYAHTQTHTYIYALLFVYLYSCLLFIADSFCYVYP